MMGFKENAQMLIKSCKLTILQMPCAILLGSMFFFGRGLSFCLIMGKKPKEKNHSNKKIANDENVQFYENPRNIKATLLFSEFSQS